MDRVTHVKFCGITSLEDGELCAEHGAWALGMIFVPTSPRRCKQTEAVRIGAAMRRRVEVAGVFQNATLDHVVHTAEAVQLSLVQLHGDEGPAYCAEVARRTGARVIKAARVKWRVDVIALKAFRTDFHMLDSVGDEPFEWSLARELRGQKIPLIVAGALTADNVADALAATDPYAVDVARGTEGEQKGVKDPAKVAAFAAAVQGTEVPA